MKTFTQPLATFQVTCGELALVDPCYSDVENYGAIVDDVVNGTWVAEIDAIKVKHEKGHRTAKLRAMLEGSNFDYVTFVDQLCVDSACFGIFDLAVHPQYSEKDITQDDWSMRLFELTRGEFPASVIEGGVTSTAGFGDGSYAATLFKTIDGKIVGVEVTFITEDELRDWEANWNF